MLIFEGLNPIVKENLYSVPMPSSDLKIFFCKSFSERTASTFFLEDIYSKGFLTPYKDGYSFFPLCHLS